MPKKNSSEEISVDNLIKRNSGTKKQSYKETDIIPTKKNSSQIEKYENEKDEPNPNSIFHKVVSLCFAFLAFLLGLVFILALFGLSDTVGSVGLAIFKFTFGLFGHGAWALPLVLGVFALCWRSFVAFENCRIKIAVASFFQLFLSSVIHVFFIQDQKPLLTCILPPSRASLPSDIPLRAAECLADSSEHSSDRGLEVLHG